MDDVTTYLKPLISEEEYIEFRNKNFCKNNWNDIVQLMYSLLTFAEKVSDRNLLTSLISSIVIKCKDAHFLTKKQIPRVDSLYNRSLKFSPNVKKEDLDIAIVEDEESLNNSLIETVKNKGKNKGYYNPDGSVALRTILLKRLHLCLSAEKRGLDFNLDDNDIKNLLERKTCYYTGARFSKSDNYRRTIDRIDNKKGYVKGNVVACTHNINQIKNLILEDGGEFKLTLKQLQMFVNKLSDKQGNNNAT